LRSQYARLISLWEVYFAIRMMANDQAPNLNFSLKQKLLFIILVKLANISSTGILALLFIVINLKLVSSYLLSARVRPTSIQY
jgi:hypothetical protein